MDLAFPIATWHFLSHPTPALRRGKWGCGVGELFICLFIGGKQHGAIDLQTQNRKAGSGRAINTGLHRCIPIECLHGNESREKISIKQQMTW